MANRHRDLLVGDQVLELQLRALVHNLRPARVAVFVAHLFELFYDDRTQLLLAGQD